MKYYKCMCHAGQFGPAIALIAASYTGCNPPLTVALLTIGVGLNGGIYSGFKVNHLDISPRFAGILMSFTNCLANFAGLLAPMAAGYITDKRVSRELQIVIVGTMLSSMSTLLSSCIICSLYKVYMQWQACGCLPKITENISGKFYNEKSV